MSKNNLKIKFTYADTVLAMEWKGHPYQKQSVEDFLNSFVEMLGMGLEVRDREIKKQLATSDKQDVQIDVDWKHVEQGQSFESSMNQQPITNK